MTRPRRADPLRDRVISLFRYCFYPLEQHHLPRFRERRSRQLVEVHSAGDRLAMIIRAVPAHLPGTGRFITVDQGSDRSGNMDHYIALGALIPLVVYLPAPGAELHDRDALGAVLHLLKQRPWRLI